MLENHPAQDSAEPWTATSLLRPQQIDDALDFPAHEVEAATGGSRRFCGLGNEFVQTVTGTADGKTLIIEQIADAADEEHFVMLVPHNSLTSPMVK
jgi:hypothetical protein